MFLSGYQPKIAQKQYEINDGLFSVMNIMLLSDVFQCVVLEDISEAS